MTKTTKRTVTFSADEAKEFIAYKKKKEAARIKNHKPTTYGYARVSTKKQNYNSQINDLVKHGIKKENIFKEKYTGKTTDRPEFDKLLKRLLPGDTVVATKLDRLARNTGEALKFMEYFQKRHITLYILNIGHIDSTPTGKLIFTVFSAFADFERNLILSRTQEGKEWARAHDPTFVDGRPNKFSNTQIKLAYRLHYGEKYSLRQTAQQTGIPVATMCRRFNTLSEKDKKQAMNE